MLRSLIPLSFVLTAMGISSKSVHILWMSIGFGLCVFVVGVLHFIETRSKV